MKNYDLKYDGGKNRIYITFKDSLKVDEAKAYLKDLKQLITTTKPNLTVCLDVSCDPVHSKEVDALFNEGRQALVEKGLKGIGTVMSKSSIAKMQVKRTLKDLNNNIFASKTEAEKYLDSL
ncbi:hypothetical protein U472_04320 [Orenia metallireducens]|uniref:STAS domain-containing protein n=1 Tax=Orenia metallireducens TaxID=1413210 RepID=A0A1C0ABN3_9FIRM|nr:hypothetical protein [Orenia metallireducens]OCL27783.1 hypothetical protein U472_04320 [Orenia metallireducens]